MALVVRGTQGEPVANGVEQFDLHTSRRQGCAGGVVQSLPALIEVNALIGYLAAQGQIGWRLLDPRFGEYVTASITTATSHQQRRPKCQPNCSLQIRHP